MSKDMSNKSARWNLILLEKAAAREQKRLEREQRELEQHRVETDNQERGRLEQLARDEQELDRRNRERIDQQLEQGRLEREQHSRTELAKQERERDDHEEWKQAVQDQEREDKEEEYWIDVMEELRHQTSEYLTNGTQGLGTQLQTHKQLLTNLMYLGDESTDSTKTPERTETTTELPERQRDLDDSALPADQTRGEDRQQGTSDEESDDDEPAERTESGTQTTTENDLILESEYFSNRLIFHTLVGNSQFDDRPIDEIKTNRMT